MSRTAHILQTLFQSDQEAMKALKITQTQLQAIKQNDMAVKKTVMKRLLKYNVNPLHIYLGSKIKFFNS